MVKAMPVMKWWPASRDQDRHTETSDHKAADHAAQPKGEWGRRMSDNVAYALLVYTGLQIFVTIHALRETGSSFLPMLALVVLVAAIIPLCRRFERRWENVQAEPGDRMMHSNYRRDQLLLWSAAAGLPFVLTGLFKAMIAAA